MTSDARENPTWLGRLRGLHSYLVPVLSLLVLLVVIAGEIHTLSQKDPLGDFGAFYTVGHILNRHPPERVYDVTFLMGQYYSLLPHAPPGIYHPYSHAPFEAILFRPFALLPYRWAYVAWQVFSLLAFWTGTALVCRTVQLGPRTSALDVCVSMLLFGPFTDGLLIAQVTAFTYFWLALAIYCDRRRRPVAAGAALAFCLSKPTTLVLILPMLVLTGRWRVLLGFGLGAAALAAGSIAVVGWQGCLAYLEMLFRFGRHATAGDSIFKLHMYVDLNSFFRQLTGGHGAFSLGLLVVSGAVLLPVLARSWWVAGNQGDLGRSIAWCSALVWNMILNVYAPIYDTAIVALALLLLADVLYKTAGPGAKLPWSSIALIAFLVLTSWLEPVPLTGRSSVQTLTLALIACGLYALWVQWTRVRATGRGAPTPDNPGASVPVGH